MPVAAALQVQENIALAPYTTIGIGGPARFFADVSSEAMLLEALRFARENQLDVLILGGGSNLLVHDAGFHGLVIHLVLGGVPEFVAVGDAVLVRASAGLVWDDLVAATCDRELSGMECLAGIPGLTGATPIQNVGAYGQEVAQTIESLRAFDRHAVTFRELPGEECGFGYRTSRFNQADRDRFIVTAVTFRLRPGAGPKPTYADLVRRFGDCRPMPGEVAEAVREIRREKGMLLVAGDPDCRSVGSFFKNPLVPAAVLAEVAGAAGVEPAMVPHWPAGDGEVKLAAAWLLERSGFAKGHVEGRVGISSRHSLALINRGGASFAELASLRDRLRAAVRECFGVELAQEPVEAS